jgi:[acyl-carrier-protein] S-malonyltransferase
MGAGLLEDERWSALCDRCAEAAGIDLRHLLTEADEDELRLTQNAQPALTFTCLGLGALFGRRGAEFRPIAAAGHSVGEYAALVLAGALQPEDAIKAVVARGRAMAEAAPAGTSTMAAVLGLAPDAISAAIADVEGVWPANFNTPTQTVIAGTVGGVEQASERLREAGARRIVPLNVSAAFHTPLMRSAAARLREALQVLDWSAPTLPVIANVDAEAYTEAGSIPDTLERQLYSPVRWADCVGALKALGVDTYVEVGPKRALTGMLRELHPEAKAINVSSVEEATTALLQ